MKSDNMNSVSNLSLEGLDAGIYFDVEMREADALPALVGVMIDGEFEIIVLEELLHPAAEYSSLRVREPLSLFENLLLQAERDDCHLIAYSQHEFDLLASMYSNGSPKHKHLLDILNRRYFNANIRKWFRKNLRESYDLLESKEKAKGKSSKFAKNNGGIRMGLKLLLQLPEVAYPDVKSAGIGYPATALREVRDHLQRKGPSVDSLTPGARRKWSKLLTYNRHDVVGMEHLLRFAVESEHRLKDMKGAQTHWSQR
jgi:hypothetical protein